MNAISSRRQAGFSYIEVLVAIAVLAVVAGGLAQGLAITSGTLSKTKVDTISGNLAAEIAEEAHHLPYADVGTPDGNPPGVLQPSQVRNVDGIDFDVLTEVVYVDDPAQGQPQTFVNYKQVAVTVTPRSVDGVPTTQATLVAPPSIGAIAGKSTIIANVVDALTGDPIAGATVTADLSTSPARTDTTDAQGRVIFAGLEPSAVSSSDPQYEYRLTVGKSGYVTHEDSQPDMARQHLAPSQTWETTLRIFKPATIQVNLRDSATNAPVTEVSTVTVTTPEPNSESESFTDQTGGFFFTTIGGDPIEPSASNFTVNVSAECYVQSSIQSPVPTGYPGTTSEVFNVDLTRVPSGDLHVTVLDDDTGLPLPDAQVQVSGGGPGISPRVREADSAGFVRYCLEPSDGTEYVVSAAAPGYGAGSTLAAVTEGAVTTLTLRLVKGTTGTIRLRTSGSNQLTRLESEEGTYDASQPTNQFGYADYTGLAPGFYNAYVATGFSGGDPQWSTGKRVRAHGGQLVEYSVP